MTDEGRENETTAERATVSALGFGAAGDGAVDDTRAIQAALDSGARHVIVPAGRYLISNALRPVTGQCLEIHGTIRVRDAVIQPLERDVAVGDSTVAVADGSRFYVGQSVTLHDEQLPIQGGGRKVRRQNAGNAIITGISGNTLQLDAASARSYLRARNAMLATQHSAVLIEHSGVRICGTGVIDGNRRRQLDAAPARLGGEAGESWWAGSGICVHDRPGPLESIVIEGVTVRDALLHNIAMRGAVRSVIRGTTCIGAHDKNITLDHCRDCAIVNNIAADSGWEDGIIFHQRPDPALANRRITISGNICAGNARNGISIGINMHEIFLSGNLCAENGINLHLNGDNCTSTGDAAFGSNGRLFPLSMPRANVALAGRRISVTNLTALGTPSTGVEITGEDISLTGGLVGELEPGVVEGDGIGIALGPGRRHSARIFPDRVTITGVTVRGCRCAVKIEAGARRVTLRDNNLAGNEQAGAIAPEAWPAVRLRDNEGLVSRSRGLARIAPDGTRITVAHGLCRTPDAAGISLVPVGAQGAARGHRLDNITGTHFDIVVDRAPGGAGAQFAWRADAEECVNA